MPASLCDHCADVSDLLSCSLSLYTFVACAAQASREQTCQMRTTHAQNYFTYLEQESVILLLWKLRELQSVGKGFGCMLNVAEVLDVERSLSSIVPLLSGFA
jgi:hypothetical protein